MKQVLLVLLMAGAGMVTACSIDNESEDEIQGVVIQQADYGDEVAEFFTTEFPPTNTNALKNNNFFTDTSQSVCQFINSEEEFQSLYQGEMTLPKIDFSKFTLVIGQQLAARFLNELKAQALYKQDNAYYMDLSYTAQTGDTHIQVPAYAHYWGIYPKLDNKEMNVRLKVVE